MTTLAALKADIADDLDDTGLTSAIATAITRAIEFYQPTLFWFNKARDVEFSTIVDQEFYSSTDDADIGRIVKIDKVVVEKTGSKTTLLRAPSLDLEGNNSNSGDPAYFAWFDDQIRLYPKPNSVETVRVTGQVKMPEPASDSETNNVWMIHCYDLIRAHATANIAARKLRDFELAQVNKVLIKEELERLDKLTVKKLGTGHVRPTEF